MPPYYPKKQTQTETRYEISADARTTYLLTVRESPTSTMLIFGGADFWCAEFQVFPSDPIANMPKIEYDDHCTLSGRFTRGDGILQLLRLALSYIAERYPHVRQIQFDDMSYRECDERSVVDLAFFYYALYGKTWYMAKLDATPVDGERFTTATAQFNARKQTMSWRDFDNAVPSAHLLPDTAMREIYDSSPTWTTFFQRVRDESDIQTLCRYMAPWITRFIKRIAGLNFSAMPFRLPVPVSPATAFTLTQQTGGRRGRRAHTHKRLRQRRGLDVH